MRNPATIYTKLQSISVVGHNGIKIYIFKKQATLYHYNLNFILFQLKAWSSSVP